MADTPRILNPNDDEGDTPVGFERDPALDITVGAEGVLDKTKEEEFVDPVFSGFPELEDIPEDAPPSDEEGWKRYVEGMKSKRVDKKVEKANEEYVWAPWDEAALDEMGMSKDDAEVLRIGILEGVPPQHYGEYLQELEGQMREKGGEFSAYFDELYAVQQRLNLEGHKEELRETPGWERVLQTLGLAANELASGRTIGVTDLVQGPAFDFIGENLTALIPDDTLLSWEYKDELKKRQLREAGFEGDVAGTPFGEIMKEGLDIERSNVSMDFGEDNDWNVPGLVVDFAGLLGFMKGAGSIQMRGEKLLENLAKSTGKTAAARRFTGRLMGGQLKRSSWRRALKEDGLGAAMRAWGKNASSSASSFALYGGLKASNSAMGESWQKTKNEGMGMLDFMADYNSKLPQIGQEAANNALIGGIMPTFAGIGQYLDRAAVAMGAKVLNRKLVEQTVQQAFSTRQAYRIGKYTGARAVPKGVIGGMTVAAAERAGMMVGKVAEFLPLGLVPHFSADGEFGGIARDWRDLYLGSPEEQAQARKNIMHHIAISMMLGAVSRRPAAEKYQIPPSRWLGSGFPALPSGLPDRITPNRRLPPGNRVGQLPQGPIAMPDNMPTERVRENDERMNAIQLKREELGAAQLPNTRANRAIVRRAVDEILDGMDENQRNAIDIDLYRVGEIEFSGAVARGSKRESPMKLIEDAARDSGDFEKNRDKDLDVAWRDVINMRAELAHAGGAMRAPPALLARFAQAESHLAELLGRDPLAMQSLARTTAALNTHVEKNKPTLDELGELVELIGGNIMPPEGLDPLTADVARVGLERELLNKEERDALEFAIQGNELIGQLLSGNNPIAQAGPALDRITALRGLEHARSGLLADQAKNKYDADLMRGVVEAAVNDGTLEGADGQGELERQRRQDHIKDRQDALRIKKIQRDERKLEEEEEAAREEAEEKIARAKDEENFPEEKVKERAKTRKKKRAAVKSKATTAKKKKAAAKKVKAQGASEKKDLVGKDADPKDLFPGEKEESGGIDFMAAAEAEEALPTDPIIEPGAQDAVVESREQARQNLRLGTGDEASAGELALSRQHVVARNVPIVRAASLGKRLGTGWPALPSGSPGLPRGPMPLPAGYPSLGTGPYSYRLPGGPTAPAPARPVYPKLPPGYPKLPKGAIVLPEGYTGLPDSYPALPQGAWLMPSGILMMPTGRLVRPLRRIVQAGPAIAVNSGIPQGPGYVVLGEGLTGKQARGERLSGAASDALAAGKTAGTQARRVLGRQQGAEIAAADPAGTHRVETLEAAEERRIDQEVEALDPRDLMIVPRGPRSTNAIGSALDVVERLSDYQDMTQEATDLYKAELQDLGLDLENLSPLQKRTLKLYQEQAAQAAELVKMLKASEDSPRILRGSNPNRSVLIPNVGDHWDYRMQDGSVVSGILLDHRNVQAGRGHGKWITLLDQHFNRIRLRAGDIVDAAPFSMEDLRVGPIRGKDGKPVPVTILGPDPVKLLSDVAEAPHGAVIPLSSIVHLMQPPTDIKEALFRKQKAGRGHGTIAVSRQRRSQLRSGTWESGEVQDRPRMDARILAREAAKAAVNEGQPEGRSVPRSVIDEALRGTFEYVDPSTGVVEVLPLGGKSPRVINKQGTLRDVAEAEAAARADRMGKNAIESVLAEDWELNSHAFLTDFSIVKHVGEDGRVTRQILSKDDLVGQINKYEPPVTMEQYKNDPNQSKFLDQVDRMVLATNYEKLGFDPFNPDQVHARLEEMRQESADFEDSRTGPEDTRTNWAQVRLDAFAENRGRFLERQARDLTNDAVVKDARSRKTALVKVYPPKASFDKPMALQIRYRIGRTGSTFGKLQRKGRTVLLQPHVDELGKPSNDLLLIRDWADGEEFAFRGKDYMTPEQRDRQAKADARFEYNAVADGATTNVRLTEDQARAKDYSDLEHFRDVMSKRAVDFEDVLVGAMMGNKEARKRMLEEDLKVIDEWVEDNPRPETDREWMRWQERFLAEGATSPEAWSLNRGSLEDPVSPRQAEEAKVEPDQHGKWVGWILKKLNALRMRRIDPITGKHMIKQGSEWVLVGDGDSIEYMNSGPTLDNVIDGIPQWIKTGTVRGADTVEYGIRTAGRNIKRAWDKSKDRAKEGQRQAGDNVYYKIRNGTQAVIQESVRGGWDIAASPVRAMWNNPRTFLPFATDASKQEGSPAWNRIALRQGSWRQRLANADPTNQKKLELQRFDAQKREDDRLEHEIIAPFMDSFPDQAKAREEMFQYDEGKRVESLEAMNQLTQEVGRYGVKEGYLDQAQFDRRNQGKNFVHYGLWARDADKLKAEMDKQEVALTKMRDRQAQLLGQSSRTPKERKELDKIRADISTKAELFGKSRLQLMRALDPMGRSSLTLEEQYAARGDGNPLAEAKPSFLFERQHKSLREAAEDGLAVDEPWRLLAHTVRQLLALRRRSEFVKGLVEDGEYIKPVEDWADNENHVVIDTSDMRGDPVWSRYRGMGADAFMYEQIAMNEPSQRRVNAIARHFFALNSSMTTVAKASKTAANVASHMTQVVSNPFVVNAYTNDGYLRTQRYIIPEIIRVLGLADNKLMKKLGIKPYPPEEEAFYRKEGLFDNPTDIDRDMAQDALAGVSKEEYRANPESVLELLAYHSKRVIEAGSAGDQPMHKRAGQATKHSAQFVVEPGLAAFRAYDAASRVAMYKRRVIQLTPKGGEVTQAIRDQALREVHEALDITHTNTFTRALRSMPLVGMSFASFPGAIMRNPSKHVGSTAWNLANIAVWSGMFNAVTRMITGEDYDEQQAAINDSFPNHNPIIHTGKTLTALDLRMFGGGIYSPMDDLPFPSSLNLYPGMKQLLTGSIFGHNDEYNRNFVGSAASQIFYGNALTSPSIEWGTDKTAINSSVRYRYNDGNKAWGWLRHNVSKGVIPVPVSKQLISAIPKSGLQNVAKELLNPGVLSMLGSIGATESRYSYQRNNVFIQHLNERKLRDTKVGPISGFQIFLNLLGFRQEMPNSIENLITRMEHSAEDMGAEKFSSGRWGIPRDLDLDDQERNDLRDLLSGISRKRGMLSALRLWGTAQQWKSANSGDREVWTKNLRKYWGSRRKISDAMRELNRLGLYNLSYDLSTNLASNQSFRDLFPKYPRRPRVTDDRIRRILNTR